MRGWPHLSRRSAIGFLGIAAWALGLMLVLDSRFPPDLSRYEDRSILVLSRESELLRAFLSTDDKWRLSTSVDEVDAEYVRLLKQVEDKRFDVHPGVDPIALVRAVGQLVSNGRVVSGASTLTMQTARLLEPRPRNVASKLIEMVRALQLEARYSKPQILDMYLTLAPFGGNIEGVRAASYAYWGKEPRHLTLSEIALLIALPQAPESTRPDRNIDGAASAKQKILRQLVDRTAISQTRASEAARDPLPQGRLEFPFLAPRLARHLRQRNPESSVIATTLRVDVQRHIETLIRQETDWIKDGASIAILAIENQSREVVAYAGGADFWAQNGQLDLVRSKRSPGSALKPFIYGMAFDDLVIHPDTLIEDRPMVFGSYAPRNFNRTFQGTVNVRTALRLSLNVPAVAVLNEVGPVRFASSLRHQGTDLQFAKKDILPSLPLALGGVGVSLFDLTQLYASLPNGGVSQPLRLLSDESPFTQRRFLSETASWYVTDTLLGSPMPDGWAQRFGFQRKRDIAFKTGTSYGFRDAWAVGYTGTYTIGVWVGRADGTARPGRFGLETAAPILLKAFERMPPETRALPSKPGNVISVRSNASLPKRLQRFEQVQASRSSRDRQQMRPPVIRFPAHGTSVVLPTGEENASFPLRVVGGKQPFRWMVNGELLPMSDRLETTYWRPASLGFANISVVDAQGRTAHSTIRIVMSKEW